MKSSAVFGHAGLAITALMIDALYASPSWMSLGFSSVYTATPGLTIETEGSVPAWQSPRNWSNVRTLSLFAFHTFGNNKMSGRSHA